MVFVSVMDSVVVVVSCKTMVLFWYSLTGFQKIIVAKIELSILPIEKPCISTSLFVICMNIPCVTCQKMLQHTSHTM